MSATNGRKTEQRYWDGVHDGAIRMRPPSPLMVSTRNFQRLLRAHVRPGMRVLEIGCAPGKYLAWVAGTLRAQVTGLDYSEPGIEMSRALFDALELKGDFVCEDVFATTLPPGSFDVVYSNGVIEHFDDPTDIIAKHVSLTGPGGTTLITIPNYGGLYGSLQGHFDAENLALHNTEMMSCHRLRELAPAGPEFEVEAFATGRLSPYLVNWHRRWPSSVAKLATLVLNAVGLLQPVDLEPLSPWLALRIRRRSGSAGSAGSASPGAI